MFFLQDTRTDDRLSAAGCTESADITRLSEPGGAAGAGDGGQRGFRRTGGRDVGRKRQRDRREREREKKLLVGF